MEKKVIVISLGGSVIIADKVNVDFLHEFKKMMRKWYKKYKFVVVCGGGTIARQYITILRQQKASSRELARAGIRATRMNAELLIQLFGKETNAVLPKTMKEVLADLKRNDIVFCGALRYVPNETTDGTAATLAAHFRTHFINITNVAGLYTDNPRTNKRAKLIKNITWKEFKTKALAMKYKPGQHFVLDQKAAKRIEEYEIPTYIVGPNVKNLNKLLSRQKFTGTTITG